jgi:hypothetical protein
MLFVQADDACRMVELDALGHEGAAPNRTGSSPDEPGKFWHVRLQTGLSRRSVSSCSDLDEPCCIEVTVECQGLADASTSHHCEACRINEGVLALPTRSEPAPSFGLGSLIDVHYLGIWERPQPVEETDRGRMPGASAQESPCLSHDVVRCDDPTNSAFHKGARLLMPGISTLL